MTVTAQQISEATYSDKPLKVDREKGIIYNVRLLGEESANGREYSLKSRESSARLYNEMPANIDHSDTPGGGGRSISDNIGVLRNTHVSEEDGAVYGDFHYIVSHAMADSIAERAEKFPTTFGFSHDAVGEMSEGAGRDGRDLVEDIVEVNSVDLVSNPATNTSLFESRNTPMSKTKKTTVRKILVANKAHKLAEGFTKLIEQDEIAAMAEAPVEMAAETEVSPDAQMKAAFRSMVMAAFDDEALDTAATLAKMKEIMKSQEKLTGSEAAPAETPAEEGNTDHVEPALEAIQTDIAKIFHGQLVSAVLEDAGLYRRDLEPNQIKLIEKQATGSEMTEIIEGFDIQPKQQRQRPQIGSKLSESRRGGDDEPETYEDLTEGRKNRSRQRRPA